MGISKGENLTAYEIDVKDSAVAGSLSQEGQTSWGYHDGIHENCNCSTCSGNWGGGGAFFYPGASIPGREILGFSLSTS